MSIDVDTPLSEAEKRVYDLTVIGHTAKGVAAKLSLSYTTIKFHLNNIRRKRGVSNTSALIALHYLGPEKFLEAGAHNG